MCIQVRLEFKLEKTMSESIGMMDKAYFVGKVEILNWFNSLLQVSDLIVSKQSIGVALIGED